MMWLLACTGSAEVAEVPSDPGTAPPHPPPLHPPPPHQQPEPFFATPEFDLQPAPGTPHRSVLIVSLDTVRADSLAPWGGRVEGLPGDRVYKRAYSHFPQTCVSHWSLMTGALPALHGNTPANRGSTWSGPTFAEIAKTEGYATAAFIGGQTLMDSQCGLSRGFDVYDDDFVIDPRDMRRHGKEVIGSAKTWIEAQDGAWFAFVHLFDAHFPYTPEENLFDPDYTGGINGDDAVLRPYRDGQRDPTPRDIEHVRALYDAEIAEMSEWLKPLWTAAGEDTLVLITSDHGESFEHGYWFNHKDSVMEGVLHVPLLLSGPGVEAGTDDAPIGLVDVAPMLLTLAGLPVDQTMEGSGTTLYGITDPFDPNGVHKWSERHGAQLRVEQKGTTTCWSWPDEDQQACAGNTRRPDYNRLLEQQDERVVDPPENAHPMTPDECQRLKALGYIESC